MMRPFLLTALAITAFSATMTVEPPEAHAVVYCAAGVVRAGCVVRPVVAPTVRGVARRTVRRSDIMLKHDISLSATSIAASVSTASATTAATRPMSA